MFIFSGKTENPTGLRFERRPGFPFWTLGSIFKGKIHVECDYGNFSVKGPCLALVEAHIPYRIEILKPTQEIYCYFTPRDEMTRILNWPRIFPGFHILRYGGTNAEESITQACREMFRLSNSPFAQNPLLLENAVERILLLAELVNPNHRHANMDERIIKAIEYIDRHPAGNLTVNKLAKEVHLSPSRFAHLFREQTGKAVRVYREERRLQEAQKLLTSTTKSVAEIAELCGFINPFHFTTRFKKLTGKAPREYRHNPTVTQGL